MKINQFKETKRKRAKERLANRSNTFIFVNLALLLNHYNILTYNIHQYTGDKMHSVINHLIIKNTNHLKTNH